MAAGTMKRATSVLNETALTLHEGGATYREVGEALHVSVERARQRVTSGRRARAREAFRAGGDPDSWEAKRARLNQRLRDYFWATGREG